MVTAPNPEWRGLPIHLDVFDGPLDLLLFLIRREEVSIYDIPVVRITEQYLAYIEVLSAVDLDRAADYLVLATTLLEIKAKMLLPRAPAAAAEEAVPWAGEADPRAELVRQLEEYQRFKAAAQELRRREEQALQVYPRGWHPEAPDLPAPLARVTLKDLMLAFREILREESAWREVPREEIPLREKIREITWRLQRHPDGLRFRDLFSRGGTRLEVVVTFLALLELMRQRRAVAEQDATFGEIWVRRAPVAPSAAAAPAAGVE